MDIELEELQYQCSQTDIDYEFVIDSSGSIGKLAVEFRSLRTIYYGPYSIIWWPSFIGAANWQQTMNLISKVWIQDAIRPKGAQKCGHHVAGRKFSACDSSSQVLFYPFLPPNPSGMLWNNVHWRLSSRIRKNDKISTLDKSIVRMVHMLNMLVTNSNENHSNLVEHVLMKLYVECDNTIWEPGDQE